MIEQEQIEEIARDLQDYACMSDFQARIAASSLLLLGYRKHGEGMWESFPSTGIQYRCSACKKKSNRKSVFCPHCGAKMKYMEE